MPLPEHPESSPSCSRSYLRKCSLRLRREFHLLYRLLCWNLNTPGLAQIRPSTRACCRSEPTYVGQNPSSATRIFISPIISETAAPLSVVLKLFPTLASGVGQSKRRCHRSQTVPRLSFESSQMGKGEIGLPRRLRQLFNHFCCFFFGQRLEGRGPHIP